MFILMEVLTALSITVVIGILFTTLFERYTSVFHLPLFFFVVFLGSWAGGFWVIPLDVAVWMVYWIPFFVGGVAFAAVVATVSMIPFFRTSVDNALRDCQEQTAKPGAIEGFLWILSAVLVVPIVLQHIDMT